MAATPAPGLYVFRSYVSPQPGQPAVPKTPYSPTNLVGVQADYYLPPVNGTDKRVLHLNKSGQAIVDMEHLAGSYPNMGAGMAYPTNAEITVTFDFLPSWVTPNSTINTFILTQNTPYGSGPGALTNAIDDFYNKVITAGLGTLVEYLVSPPSAHAYRYTAAVVASDVTVTYTPGSRAQLDLVFNCPSGLWTNDNGSRVYIR